MIIHQHFTTGTLLAAMFVYTTVHTPSTSWRCAILTKNHDFIVLLLLLYAKRNFGLHVWEKAIDIHRRLKHVCEDKTFTGNTIPKEVRDFIAGWQ